MTNHIKKILLLFSFVFCSLLASAQVTTIPTNEIHYTSSDGKIVTPSNLNAFDANIISNTYKDGKGIITFDATISTIKYGAYSYSSTLISIIIPSSVTSIEDYAFYFCSSLAHLELPKNVSHIGERAFSYCTALVSIDITSNANIAPLAFASCNSLELIKIYNSVSIGWGTFFYCDNLQTVKLYTTTPPSLGDSEDHSIFTSARPLCYIPCGTLEAYQASAWANQVSTFEEIDCPIDPTLQIHYTSSDGNIISFSSSAFGSTIVSNTYENGLGTITCDGPITTIKDWACNGRTTLTSIELPETVQSIGKGAFGGCTSLVSINLPNTITAIGAAAFNACEALQSVIIPSNVTKIENYTFEGCTSLSTVVISASVDSIKTGAFGACSAVDTITFLSNTPPILQGSYTFSSKPHCHIPCGTLGAYQASSWAKYVSAFEDPCFVPDPTWQIHYTSTDGNIVTPYRTNKFGANIVSNTYENGQGTITLDGPATIIGSSAFSGCSTLKSITIPQNVTTIDNEAFRNCSALQSVILPDDVLTIGKSAFNTCSALASINLPNTITAIGAAAFNACSSLTSIILPDKLTTIEGYTFENCTSLTSVVISANMDSIGAGAFSVCTALESVTLNATTPPIINSSFYKVNPFICHIPCGTLAAYIASDWAKYVSTFEDPCYIDPTWQIHYTSSDGNIVTPYDVNALGATIVSNTYENGQGTITFDGPVTRLGNKVFYERSRLTTIDIPEVVTSIGDNAFQHCYSLTAINIPEAVTSIGEAAFGYCKQLVSIKVDETNPIYDSRDNCNAIIETSSNTLIIGCKSSIIPNSVTKIGNYTFHGCDSLTEINIPEAVTSIGERTFSGCSSLTDINIPQAVTSIGSYAFYNCSSLTEINIPEAVTSIGRFAFAYCSSLTAINIPEAVTSIGERTFYNCSKLTSINIPQAVTSIRQLAFSGCTSLSKITCQPLTPPTLAARAFNNINANATIHISCDAIEQYRSASNWSTYSSKFRDACLNIYHYTTPNPGDGVYETSEPLVARITYKRTFTPNKWETLYLPFDVESVTIYDQDDKQDYPLTPWSIVNGGHYYLAKPDGAFNKEIIFAETNNLEGHTTYIVNFPNEYYRDKVITFHGAHSWNQLETSFVPATQGSVFQIAANNTLQSQTLDEPVYLLRASSNFIFQPTSTTLHPFECYLLPPTFSSSNPSKLPIRFQGDNTTTDLQQGTTQESIYYSTSNDELTIYAGDQPVYIYTVGGHLLHTAPAGNNPTTFTLGHGCYILQSGNTIQKIVL